MLTLAQEAAKRAGEVLRRRFGRELAVRAKAPADYVTDVDIEAEQAIRALLEREAPDHGLVLEEGGSTRAEAEYQWLVDPLDGTTNYLHCYPFFSVAIALRRRRETVVGVVYDPLRGEMFTAEKGGGTCLNGVPVRVSATAEPEHALIATGFPFRSREWLDPYLELFRSIFLATGGTRRDGSAALDHAYVACGRYEAFWELGLAPWDVAAGALLVAEAGGRVTDFHGGADAVDGGDVVASNGLIHDRLLALVGEVFAERRPR